METNILDQFDEHLEMVLLRYFPFDSQAQFYAVNLRNADIPCFLSNQYGSTMLPLGGTSNIALYVRKQDVESANQLLATLDEELLLPSTDEEQEELSVGSSKRSRSFPKWLNVVLGIILFLIFYSLLSRVSLFPF